MSIPIQILHELTKWNLEKLITTFNDCQDRRTLESEWKITFQYVNYHFTVTDIRHETVLHKNPIHPTRRISFSAFRSKRTSRNASTSSQGVFIKKDYYRLYISNREFCNVGWVINHGVTQCMLCNHNLGSFLRGNRHHCRSCGNIICSKCSKHRTTIDMISETASVRVCDRCFHETPITLKHGFRTKGKSLVYSGDARPRSHPSFCGDVIATNTPFEPPIIDQVDSRYRSYDDAPINQLKSTAQMALLAPSQSYSEPSAEDRHLSPEPLKPEIDTFAADKEKLMSSIRHLCLWRAFNDAKLTELRDMVMSSSQTIAPIVRPLEYGAYSILPVTPQVLLKAFYISKPSIIAFKNGLSLTHKTLYAVKELLHLYPQDESSDGGTETDFISINICSSTHIPMTKSFIKFPNPYYEVFPVSSPTTTQTSSILTPPPSKYDRTAKNKKIQKSRERMAYREKIKKLGSEESDDVSGDGGSIVTDDLYSDDITTSSHTVSGQSKTLEADLPCLVFTSVTEHSLPSYQENNKRHAMVDVAVNDVLLHQCQRDESAMNTLILQIINGIALLFPQYQFTVTQTVDDVHHEIKQSLPMIRMALPTAAALLSYRYCYTSLTDVLVKHPSMKLPSSKTSLSRAEIKARESIAYDFTKGLLEYGVGELQRKEEEAIAQRILTSQMSSFSFSTAQSTSSLSFDGNSMRIRQQDGLIGDETPSFLSSSLPTTMTAPPLHRRLKPLPIPMPRPKPSDDFSQTSQPSSDHDNHHHHRKPASFSFSLFPSSHSSHSGLTLPTTSAKYLLPLSLSNNSIRAELSSDMMRHVTELSLDDITARELKIQAKKDHSLLVGWQVLIPDKIINHDTKKKGIYVITGFSQVPMVGCVYRISSLVEEDDWVKLLLPPSMKGHDFTLLRRVLELESGR